MLSAAMDDGANVPEGLEETVIFLKDRIREDPLSADLQWSLFVSASVGYRFDTVLRPFPPMYKLDNDEKDIKSLLQFIEKMPIISEVPQQWRKFEAKELQLIQWVLDSRVFSLKKADDSQFEEIRQLTGHTVKVSLPDFIFEVVPSNAVNDKFERLRAGRRLLYAYHGSRLENFYSILNNGLVNNMNKVSVFGEGTYLSGELSVSLIYSPSGQAWDHSSIGNMLSCVAVCEMIDDPAVKCQDKKDGEAEKSSPGVRSRAKAGSSEGGDVPDKYYVVQNDKVIRVKYILVYAQRTNTHRSRAVAQQTWYQRNKFMVMMMLYAVILCLVGLTNSNMWRRLWRFR